MNKIQAFENCLETNKNNMSKSVWAGYKHRLKMGNIKDATITSVLTKYGWSKVSDEEWENDSAEPTKEESPAFKFVRYNSVSRAWEMKRVKTATIYQAIKKAGKKWQFAKSSQSVINIINKANKENGAKKAISSINSDLEG